MPKPNSDSERRWPDYRTVWRWHFYAGLVCIPFVLWLSVTGSIYLFKPQIERLLDRPYENLTVTGGSAQPSTHVRAALDAVPGSVLNAYELPATPQSAVRVLVGQGDRLIRVYVHPQTAQVLRVIDEDERFMRIIFHLHGELLQGDRGSMIVETAASWIIVLLITGLFLWWPRDRASLGGVVYPRLTNRGRLFWRDMHAVTGMWVSFFTLFLLVSGLPWAKSWGGMLKEVRQWSAQDVRLAGVTTQDWTTGRSSELAERRAANTQPAAGRGAGHEVSSEHAMSSEHVVNSEHAVSSEHAASSGHAIGSEHPLGSKRTLSSEHAQHLSADHAEATAAMTPAAARAIHASLDRLVPTVQAARLDPPVLIAPPSAASSAWTARSETQNRPRRVTLALDPAAGAVLSRAGFSQKPFIDRAVAVGVAAHEGQLFGPLNQALGLFTTIGLITLSIGAINLWWRRRSPGTLGAPPPEHRPRLAIALFAVIAVLGVLLPLFGLSLLVVLALEAVLLRRVPAMQRVLGLQA